MTSPQDRFNKPLSAAEHEDGDKHLIGESLPIPAQIRSILINDTGTPGISPIPAREDHIHDIDLTGYVRDDDIPTVPGGNPNNPSPVDLSNYYTKDEVNELLLLFCTICASIDPENPTCWYEWRIETYDVDLQDWVGLLDTDGSILSGFLLNEDDPIPFDIDSLSPDFAYRLIIREICDAIPGEWDVVPFIPDSDWETVCAPEFSPSYSNIVFNEASIYIPVICGTA